MRPWRPPERGRGPAQPGARRPREGTGNRRPPDAAGGRSGPRSALTKSIDPFDLFCAYHLGIGPDKRYAHANIHDVARRFGVDAGVIRQALQEHGMDPEAMMNRDFDLAMAQLDIQVAPEGIDRIEVAKELYAQFRSAAHKPRDWRRLLAEDERENAKTFGRR
jgi:transposase-like protein